AGRRAARPDPTDPSGRGANEGVSRDAAAARRGRALDTARLREPGARHHQGRRRAAGHPGHPDPAEDDLAQQGLMTRYVLRRLILVVPVLLLVTIGIFSLVYLTPGDPLTAILGQEGADPQVVAVLRARLGLD